MFCVRWGMRYMKLLRTFTLCWLSLEKFSNGKCDLFSVLKQLSMDFKCGQYVCCIQGRCKLGAAYSTLLGSSWACSLTAHRCLVEFDIILIEIERNWACSEGDLNIWKVCCFSEVCSSQSDERITCEALLPLTVIAFYKHKQLVLPQIFSQLPYYHIAWLMYWAGFWGVWAQMIQYATKNIAQSLRCKTLHS
jgi:hypothetical protein